MHYRNRVTAAMLAAGVLAAAPQVQAQSGTGSTATGTGTGTTGSTSDQPGRWSTPLGVAQVGVEGGWTISNFVGNELDDASNRNGAYGGLAFIIQPSSSAVGFQTGVLFAQKGAKSASSSNAGIPVTNAGVRLSYIEVPAMLRIGVPLNVAGIAPTVIGGASLAWRIGCRTISESGNTQSSTNCDDLLQNEDGETRRFDLGTTVGVELPIKLGERYLAVPSVRYTRGLRRISDANNNDIKNSSVMIGLGFRFR